jgi:antitoxin (DNA-binding transcriptional repressor) of toxin-antitoxin stability system
MTTLTITDAKKNLGKWLSAAIKGQDIGIVAGATIVALRPVKIEATDYAWQEYGVTPSELNSFVKAENARIAKMMHAGDFIVLPNNPEQALEKNRSSSAPTRKSNSSRCQKTSASKRFFACLS